MGVGREKSPPRKLERGRAKAKGTAPKHGGQHETQQTHRTGNDQDDGAQVAVLDRRRPPLDRSHKERSMSTHVKICLFCLVAQIIMLGMTMHFHASMDRQAERDGISTIIEEASR